MYIDIKNFDHVTRQNVPYDGLSSFEAGSLILRDVAGAAKHFAADWDGRASFGIVFKGTEEAGVVETSTLDVIYGPAIIETDNVTPAVLALNVDDPVTIKAAAGVGVIDVLTTPASDSFIGKIMEIDAPKGRITISFKQV